MFIKRSMFKEYYKYLPVTGGAKPPSSPTFVASIPKIRFKLTVRYYNKMEV